MAVLTANYRGYTASATLYKVFWCQLRRRGNRWLERQIRRKTPDSTTNPEEDVTPRVTLADYGAEAVVAATIDVITGAEDRILAR